MAFCGSACSAIVWRVQRASQTALALLRLIERNAAAGVMPTGIAAAIMQKGAAVLRETRGKKSMFIEVFGCKTSKRRLLAD